MKEFIRLCFWLGAVTIFIQGCGGESSEECVFVPQNVTPVTVNYQALTDELLNIETKSELVDWLGKNPVIRDNFFRRAQYPNDSVFINELYRRFTNPYIDSLRLEVTRVFGDETELQEQFKQAFTNLKYYYPDFNPPVVQTLITGIDNDLYVSDSLILVSLDYFLGDGARYRPNMYEYLLRQYRKDNIVPSIMLVIGMTKYNYTDMNDETVLADMVAYGKAFYFAKHTLPCTADTILIWYTADEISGARENQDMIWYRLLEDQVLYETSHVVKQRYLGERPATLEVGEKCPGRIGQWVGWEIVNAYMKQHPERTLPELMSMMDADKIFKESKYKPIKK